MKKSRFIISLFCIMLVVVIAIGVLAGCDLLSPKKYTVTFTDDGQEIGTATVESGSKVTADQVPTPTRDMEGLDFIGWLVGSTNILDYNVHGDVTAEASFKVSEYDVVFKNGDTVLRTSKMKHGTVLKNDNMPSNPQSADGKEFDGWYVNGAKITKGVYRVTGNIEVVAMFKDDNAPATSYIVTFVCNGKVKHTLYNIKYNSVFTSEQVPSADDAPEGQYFDGWYVDGIKVVIGEFKVKGDLTITAVYKPVGQPVAGSMLTYNVNDTPYWVVTGPVAGDKISSNYFPPTPGAPEGKEFDGWYDGSTKVVADEYVIKGNTTFVAKFVDKQTEDPNQPENPDNPDIPDTPDTYTVVFENDGTAVKTLTNVAPNTQLTAADIPSVEAPDGYAFDGWYIGSSKVEAGYEVTVNITITAQFVPNKYTFTFKNGDEVVETLTDVVYGSTLTDGQIPSAPEVPEGKRFAGWFDGETQIAAGYVVVGEVNATAKFVDATYTVTFMSGDTVLLTLTVAEGTTLTEEQLPETPAAPQYQEFEHWTVGGKYAYPLGEINTDTVFTAKFKYSDGEENGWYFKWHDNSWDGKPDGFSAYGYHGTETVNVTMPSTFHGQPVFALGHFYNYASNNSEFLATIKSIIIPDNITYIIEGALERCTSLEELTIPFVGQYRGTDRRNFVDDDMKGTFGILFHKNWEAIIDPETGMEYDYHSTNIDKFLELQETPNLRYIIPESLKKVTVLGGKIISAAFKGCKNIEEVVLGDQVNGIHAYAFSGCEKLTTLSIADSVTYIESRAFADCNGLTSTAFLPEGIKEIGEYAFAWCKKLTNVVLPSSVEKVGEDAFWLTAWYDALPSGLAYIGHVLYEYKTFGVADMPANTHVNIAPGTTVITEAALQSQSKMTSVTIPAGIKEIPQSAFQYCKGLTSIVIPEGVVEIGVWAFESCENLMDISLPDSLQIIDQDAFNGTAWYKAQPVGEIAYIGDFAYRYKSDSEHMLPEGTELVLREGTKGIVNRAFYGQTGLVSITLPDTVQYIGHLAFEKCSNLEKVCITDVAAFCTITTTYSNIFFQHYCDLYLNGEIVKDLVIPDGVTEIKDEVFSNCGSIESVTIPVSLVKMGSDAINYWASKLTDVYYAGTKEQWKAIEQDQSVPRGVIVHCSDGDVDFLGNEL